MVLERRCCSLILTLISVSADKCVSSGYVLAQNSQRGGTPTLLRLILHSCSLLYLMLWWDLQNCSFLAVILPDSDPNSSSVTIILVQAIVRL